MTSSRPYLIRALYEWLVANQQTPYLLVDASIPGTRVPTEHVVNGNIILNLTPDALSNLKMTNKDVSFSARFERGHFECLVPIPAVLAIYSNENGRGMFFNEDDLGDESWDDETKGEGGADKGAADKGRAKGASHLRVIK